MFEHGTVGAQVQVARRLGGQVTPTVCRAVVEGTGGNGIYLRDAPQGEQLVILPDGTLLTVLEDAPVEAGGFVWRKVRAVGGEEGWAAQDFLTMAAFIRIKNSVDLIAPRADCSNQDLCVSPGAQDEDLRLNGHTQRTVLEMFTQRL